MQTCAEPRCPAIVTKGRCAKHGGTRGPWHHTTRIKRTRGRGLQRLRQDLFRRTLNQQIAAGHLTRVPLCVLCLTRPATIRDHTVPLQFGGTDTRDNEQALCVPCHNAKTHKESMQGRAR